MVAKMPRSQLCRALSEMWWCRFRSRPKHEGRYRDPAAGEEPPRAIFWKRLIPDLARSTTTSPAFHVETWRNCACLVGSAGLRDRKAMQWPAPSYRNIAAILAALISTGRSLDLRKFVVRDTVRGERVFGWICLFRAILQGNFEFPIVYGRLYAAANGTFSRVLTANSLLEGTGNFQIITGKGAREATSCGKRPGFARLSAVVAFRCSPARHGARGRRGRWLG